MRIHLAINIKGYKADSTLQSSNSTSGNLLQGNNFSRGKSHLCKDVQSSPIHKKRISPIHKLLSHVQLFVTPWTVARQDPLSMGILQARILEWVASSFSRESSQPRNWTQVSCIVSRFFTIWATREDGLTDSLSKSVCLLNIQCSVLLNLIVLGERAFKEAKWGHVGGL